MSVKEQYTVKSIEKSLCKDWCINKHYAHRLPPIEHAFGLFDTCNIMIGICTFGTPASATLRRLWSDTYKLKELNRLVVNEGLERNALSFFLSKSLSLLPKPLVIVSYADTSKFHHGYIYQATNWIYTGLSVPFKDYAIKGKEHLHSATIMDMSRGKESRVEWLRKKFGEELIMIDRPRKHRYFYFIGNKREQKEMLKMLPYKQETYPKGNNIRYDASYDIKVQLSAF